MAVKSGNVRDIVNEIVNETNKRFAPVFALDEDGYNGLMVCCDIIQSMIECYNITAYEFEIDEDSTDIIFSLETKELILQSNEADPNIYRLIRASKCFNVSGVGGSAISVKLVFPGIWNKEL